MDPNEDNNGKAESATDADTQASTAIAPGSAGDGISSEVARLFELVPAIGTRWRWYDVPYRIFEWLLASWRRRLLPWRLRRFILKGMNFFLAFDHYERSKVQPLDDPMETLIVPVGEQVTQGGIWVADFFPPSHYLSLHLALKSNGWDKESHLTRVDGTNAEQIARARQGRGFAWSRLGTVINPGSKYLVFDAKQEVLPEEFSLIELSAVQMGRSLTAVVAFVRLSEHGQACLNAVWTARHEPRLEWRGFRQPHVENRYFAAIRATQRERQRLHDLARAWLARRCGGFFAGTEAGQPVVDFSLFAQFDPTSEKDSRSLGDPLRALGMEGNYLHNYVSPQIPGAVFVPATWHGIALKPLKNCWGVVGSYLQVSNRNDRVGYGEKPYSVVTLAVMHDDAIHAFLLHVAILRYIDELRGMYTVARDRARSQHRRFSSRRLEQLRSELLATSLDLPVVARDSATLWDDRWRRLTGIEVRAEPAPSARPREPEGFDLIEQFGRAREEAFPELLEEDRAYREVLSTVSSLGASAEASRLGRRALVVAGTSLVVALVTMLVANTGDQTLWSELIEWMQG